VASTLGRVPAGPALRQQDPIRLSPGRGLEYPKGLCASAHGLSLHAATTARADDAVGREALCKYILRPPIAQENIQLLTGDLVRLRLKRPFSDGTFALDLDPLSVLVRLATTVAGSCRPTAEAGRRFRRHERMRLRALVMTTSGIERYLSWLGEPIDPPTLAPARDPPFFKSQVIRRRLGEAAQAELFVAH